MNTVAKLCGALVLAGALTPALAAPAAKPAPAPAPSHSTMSSAGSLQEGQIEVGGLFAWIKADANDVGIAFISGGYMFTDSLEGHLGWTAILGDTSGGLITPGFDWFLPVQAPVLPYVGAGYALAYGDLADADSIDLHVGVKQFLTERIALDYRLTHLEPTDTAVDGFEMLMVGFSYYL